jgi:hypothetical protein
MDAVGKYLRAVRFWLPREQRDDIIAELGEDLRTQVEEREAVAGHSLSDAEVKALLHARSAPMDMAARYLPPRHLVGPALFPTYRFILRMFLFCYIIPAFLIGVGALAIGSDQSLIQGLSWSSVLAFPLQVGAYGFAIITAIFALIERSQARAKDGAQAGQLPDPHRISRLDAIVALVAAAIAAAIWARTMGTDGSGALAAGSLGRWFYWPVLVFLMASVLMAVIELWRGRWTRSQSQVHLALTGAAVLVFAAMIVLWANGHHFIDIVAPSATPDRIAEGEKWLNRIWAGTVLGVLIGLVVSVFQDIRRLRQV